MWTLRNYQSEAVNSVVSHFSKSKENALIVLPTGAGKSIIIAQLCKIAKSKVLVLAHVKELVEQNHEKCSALGIDAGIYCAGMNQKSLSSSIVFASIQSLSNVEDLPEFGLVIIDECHRVSLEENSQYQQLFKRLSPAKFLGLTATPYRLNLGWIYNHHYQGIFRTSEPRFFRQCIYELSLRYLVNQKYLTPPIQLDAPVACYDFSKISRSQQAGSFDLAGIKQVLADSKRITPSIVESIVSQAKSRKGVMIFTSTINHAKEVLKLLPRDTSQLVTSYNTNQEREIIIKNFKAEKIKFLVNVSVLTTGFDAPHVDLIAVLRPTESISLFQQIVGRGLRLYPGKQDCLVLDFTDQGHNLYAPEIDMRYKAEGAMPVKVECPKCNLYNDFWGIMDEDGEVIEHFGQRCSRGELVGEKMVWCDHLFRFKLCPSCHERNMLSARSCASCKLTLMDPDQTLKEAMSLKNAHVLKVEEMILEYNQDKITIKHYDQDAEFVEESFKLDDQDKLKKFYYSFAQMHLRYCQDYKGFNNLYLAHQDKLFSKLFFRPANFVIARKYKKSWVITEKIFN